MKLFKRFAALALAGVMTLGLLTGCASSSNAYGDMVVDSALLKINTIRNEELWYYNDDDQLEGPLEALKNDPSLRRELRSMLNKIDEEGDILGKDAIRYQEKSNTNGRLEGTYKMVLTFETAEWADRFFSVREDRSIQDMFENEWLEADAFNLDEYDYEDLFDLLDDFDSVSPYMEAFAIDYHVNSNGMMYIAIGFTMKNVPTWLLPNRPNTGAPIY